MTKAPKIIAKLTEMDAAELRFAKQQQWYVAAAAVGLNGAAFSFLKGSQPRCLELAAALIFIALVAGGGVVVLLQLQNRLQDVRRNSEADPPWHRSTDVFWHLAFVVLSVTAALLYCLVHPLQPITHG
jgi:hypothetical protein